MYLAKIHVHHKASILDPQGEAVKNALHRLGYDQIDNISQGKYFEVKIQADAKEAAEDTVKDICKELLVNQNMEAYDFTLKEV
jgi:phosphoribosylformylglycinamidine synthase subunit PurS